MTIYKLKYGENQSIVYDTDDKFTYCYINRKLGKPVVLGPITAYEVSEKEAELDLSDAFRSRKES